MPCAPKCRPDSGDELLSIEEVPLKERLFHARREACHAGWGPEALARAPGHLQRATKKTLKYGRLKASALWGMKHAVPAGRGALH